MENVLPNDPLFSQQWHLNNTGQSGGTSGADINVLDAWQIATGNGVVIGVVDGGIEFKHPDLKEQYLADLSFNFADDNSGDNLNSQTSATTIFSSIVDNIRNKKNSSSTNKNLDSIFDFYDEPTDIHGTPVAGILAAANNELGVTGVAYDASFTGLRIQFNDEQDLNELDAQLAGALSHQNQEIDIYNNSWLPSPLLPLGESTTQALETSISEGRNGLGNIYVFAAGNEGQQGGNVNYYPLANSRYTIAVGAINHNGVKADYSNPGSSLFVSAYANDDDKGIVTTDLQGNKGFNRVKVMGIGAGATGVGTGATGVGAKSLSGNIFGPSAPISADTARSNVNSDFDSPDYTNFLGTSAATPIVSGIIALMLEVNPNLTWRDVQHILVETSVQNDPDNSDWKANGAGYLVNHNYGFGTVDAEAAVTASQEWETVSPEVTVSSQLIDVDTNISGNNREGVNSSIKIEENIKIEWVEIVADADLIKDDLQVILTSPDGTQSLLSDSNSGLNSNEKGNWTFTSVRHWGESSAGEWSLTIRDNEESNPATKWDAWQLKIYGTDNNEENNSVSPPDDVVYRFLNNNSGVHFYTSNETERDFLQDNLDNFSYEGISYGTVDPLTGNENIAPVYRFLNRDTGVHVYTISATERDFIQDNLNNFSFEGEVFSAYTSKVEGSIPIYRFLNVDSGTHFYTPSAMERNTVENNLPSYSYEGVAYYALPMEEIV